MNTETLKLMLALYGASLKDFDILLSQTNNFRRIFQYMYHHDLISEACADWLEDEGYFDSVAEAA